MSTTAIQTFTFKKLEPFIRPERLVEIAATFKPAPTTAGIAIPRGTVLGIVTSTGLYTPYASGNSDGSQKPVALCVYDISVDNAGNVTYTTVTGQAGNEFGVTDLDAPVAIGGYFSAADVVGLDANGLTNNSSWGLIGSLTTGTLNLG